MGAIKKGLFKVFWREYIKQWRCEPGVGNTTLWIGEAVSRERGQAEEAGTVCAAEDCQPGRIPFTWTLSGWCHTESSGPHSSCVPRDGVGRGEGDGSSSTAHLAHAPDRETEEGGSSIFIWEFKATPVWIKLLEVFREENISAVQALLTGRVGDDGPAAECDLR